MSDKLDSILKKYDRAIYEEGGIIVEKNGLYGVINKEGEKIIPCKFAEWYDVWHEWQDMGFTTSKPKIRTAEQVLEEERKIILEAKRNELIEQGHIKRLSFYKGRSVNGAAFARLPYGKIGVAASVIAYDAERDKNLEILDENGKHLIFISEPELLKGIGTPHLVICSDEESIYVGSYGNEFSYLASYRMGDFERNWKRPMYGSRIQSITVNDNDLIAFDYEDGIVKYFDKKTGACIEGKNFDTKTIKNGYHVKSNYDLAATNEITAAVIPGVKVGVTSELPKFFNEIEVYDNKKAKQMASATYSTLKGPLKSIAIDRKNRRVFLGIDNKIGVFDKTGYIGLIPQTTRNIIELNFNSQTGSLMVSMEEGKGKVEILDTEAINTMIDTSNKLLNGDVSTLKLGKETLGEQDQTSYIDETMQGVGKAISSKGIDKYIE